MKNITVKEWYKSHLNHFYFITSIDKRINYYGTIYYGSGHTEWVPRGNMDFKSPTSRNLKRALIEEVLDALIKEAKKRGFKTGSEFVSVGGKRISKTLQGELKYNKYGLYYGAYDITGVIMNANGEWAIPKETIKTEEIKDDEEYTITLATLSKIIIKNDEIVKLIPSSK